MRRRWRRCRWAPKTISARTEVKALRLARCWAVGVLPPSVVCESLSLPPSLARRRLHLQKMQSCFFGAFQLTDRCFFRQSLATLFWCPLAMLLSSLGPKNSLFGAKKRALGRDDIFTQCKCNNHCRRCALS